MRPVSFVALAVTAALVGACFGCSGGANGASGGGSTTTGSGGGAGVTYTVLARGTLKGDEAASKALHETLVSGAQQAAEAAGDVGHDTFLGKDAAPGAPLDFLAIDRWTSLDGLDAFFAGAPVKDFESKFYAAAPDVSVWQPEQGFTTWGSTADAHDAGAYTITLRGHHAGDEATALATHNAIVAAVPAPGAVALGNVAHQIFSNPKDPTEILIVEVWANQANQEMIYSNPDFQKQIAKLWSDMPTIRRWTGTGWTGW
jgi:quinol monooxygenase YgiN